MSRERRMSEHAAQLRTLAAQIETLTDGDEDTAALALREIAGELRDLAAGIALAPTLREDDGAYFLPDQTSYDSTSGVYYEPFVKDGRAGYRVVQYEPAEGRETFLYFNPSDSTDDGVPNVFVYQGGENDPAQDGSEAFHIVVDLVDPDDAPLPYADAGEDACHGCGNPEPMGQHYEDCVLREPGDVLLSRATGRATGIYEGPEY